MNIIGDENVLPMVFVASGYTPALIFISKISQLDIPLNKQISYIHLFLFVLYGVITYEFR